MDFKEEIKRQIPPDIPTSYLAGGEPLFYAFECILLQTETYNGYIFTAVNINNGRRCVISRRKNPLYTHEDVKFAEKIWHSGIAGARLLEIEKPFGEKIDFKKSGETLELIFRELLPNHGFVIRQEQIDMARHILETLYKRCSTLVESETGTGKTLAYIVAAIIIIRGRVNDFWNMGFYPGMQYADYANLPLVIATSSIALQKAILIEYIPQLSEILLQYGIIRKPLNPVLRKGKEHYICDKRLAAQIKFESSPVIKEHLESLKFTSNIDLAEITVLPPRIKNKICVAEKCGAKSCSLYGYCRYIEQFERSRSNEFDIQICNHNYLLADTFRRIEGQKVLIPNYQMLIVDEAHKYVSAARSMYNTDLNDNELPDLIDAVKRLVFINPETRVKIESLLDLLEDKNNRLFRNLNNNIIPPEDGEDTERLTVNIDSDAARHIRKIRDMITTLYELLELKPIKSESEIHLRKITGSIRSLLKKVNELSVVNQNIYWYEQSENENVLYATPKDLGIRLFEGQWSKGIPTIFVSGTLSAGGDFSNTKRVLGLERLGSKLSEFRTPSPFNHRKNTLLYISEETPFPDYKNPDYTKTITDEIERLILASHGHAAVLFTSYNFMGRVYSELESRKFPFNMFRLERSTSNAIERFKQSKNGVLFASGSLWEGVDIPGDALSMLIIVKLPFAVPDPIGEYEQSLYKDIKEYKARVVVPEMLIKLKQGFGRLIRSETDTGCVAILDSRINKNGLYRRRVLDALPDCLVTNDINAVDFFYRVKKSPDYFK